MLLWMFGNFGANSFHSISFLLMKPNLILIAQWISALRSGEYKQGVDGLKQEKSEGIFHCCLGVACELTNLKNEKEPWGAFNFKGSDGEIYASLPPTEVSESFGFNLMSHDWHRGLTLYSMNDSGWSFQEISNYIEDRFLPQMRHS